MKKKFMAMLLGTLVLLNTFGADFVSFAEGGIESVEDVDSTDEEESDSVETESTDDVETKDEIDSVEEDDADTTESADEISQETTEDITEEAEATEVVAASEGVIEAVEETIALEETEEEAAEEEETEEETEETEVSFEQFKTINGVQVTLTAAEGVLPEGAYFNVTELIDSNTVSSIENAVEKKLSDSQEITKVRAFDITIKDVEGNDIQPDSSKGNVTVSFSNIDTSEAKSDDSVDMDVYHVTDDAKSASDMGATVGNGEVSFDTEHFSTYALVYTENEEKKTIDISDLTVKMYMGGDELDSTSTDNIQITSDTEFTAKYTFPELPINTSDDKSLKNGITYTVTPNITGLSQFNLKDAVTADVKSEDGTKYGTITITPDANDSDQASIAFTPTYEEAGELKDVSFEFSFKLETDTNKTSNREVTLLDGNKYSFIVSDLVTTPPTLAIDGALSSSDSTKAEWTVTITNANTPAQYKNGYTVNIKLNDGETYVPNSSSSNSTKYDADTNTLIITIADPNTSSNAVTTITYKTTTDYPLTEEIIKENSKAITATLEDTATLNDNSDNSQIGEQTTDTVTSSKSLGAWVAKDGGTVTSAGQVSWTITIKNNGYGLNNVVLYDSFDDTMSLVSGSVKLDDVVVSSDEILSAGTDINGTSYNWGLNIGDMSGDETVTITYKTEIKDYSEYLKQNHSSKPKNTAWINYDYDFGDGTKTFVGPSVVKEAAVNLQSGISIVGAGYNAATHELTWRITVNDGMQSVKGVKVLDLIPSEQKYVEGSISKITLTGSDSSTEIQVTPEKYTNPEDSSTNNLLIDLDDNLDGNKAVFTLKTKLTDDAVTVWSDNKSGDYYNYVELEQTGYTTNQAANAKQTYYSTVLTTQIDNYNYNNHTVDVTVVVDANKMEMKNTTVTNNMVYSGYKYVLNGDVKVNGEVLSEDSYSYDSDGNLIISLGTINDTKTITFTANVESDYYTTVNNGTFKINNTASLSTDDTKKISTNYQVHKTSTELTITNSILKKEGTGSQSTGIAEYTVYINKARNTLPAGTFVRDILGSSLELDSLSVALYECTMNADGTLEIHSEALTSDKYTVNTSLDSTTNKTIMDVTIPEGNSVYVLKYSAQLTDTTLADCSNNISMWQGSTSTAAAPAVNLKTSFKAGATFTGAVYANIVAKNEAGNPLSGVKYGIYDADDNLILQTITKSDGVAKIITTKLKKDNTYTVKELTTPATYDAITDAKPVGTITPGNSSSPNEVEFIYVKKSTEIEIFNRIDSEDGELLDGSTLTLYKDGVQIDSWNSKDANSKTVKVYLDSTYVLKDEAPFGYIDGSNITFKITEDDDGKLVIEQIVPDGDNRVVTAVNMVNTTKGKFDFTISKISDGQGNDLIGAELILSEESDKAAAKDNNISSWTTDGSAKEFALPAGDYYLHEITAPAGYDVAASMHIVITTDGEITVGDETVDDAKITMVDSYKTKTITDENGDEIVVPDSTTTFTISPDTLGIDPTIFEEMKFTLFILDPIEGKLSYVTPITVDEDTLESVYDLKYQEEYILKPTAEIEGYDPVEPITIKIVGTTNEDGEVETSLLTKPMGSTVFTDSTITELGKNMTPKLTPVVVPDEPATEVTEPVDKPAETTTETPSEVPAEETTESENTQSSSSNGSHHSHYGAAPATDVADEELTIKEHQIIAMEDNANSAPTLAKTGGFIGTLIAYLAAVLLIVCGLFLVFGKEKRVK